MNHGEVVINRIESVEDTKGGNNGILILSNLRIIWFSSKTSKLNISKKITPILNTQTQFTILFCNMPF